MRDHPQAEACPAEPQAGADQTAPAPERAGEALYDQVAKVLPRLTTIGGSVALLAPVVINGLDSYGRGTGC